MSSTSLVPQNWEVPQIFRKRLGTSYGRQRTMEADGHVLLVVHLPPEPDEKGRRGRLLWRNPQGEWRSSDSGSGLVAVRGHLKQYSDRIDEFEKAEEAATTADAYLPLLEGLAPLARSVRNLEQVMQEARKLAPEDRNLIDFRDQAYELSRNTELLYTDTRNGMEIAVIRRAEQQARAAEASAIAANRFNLLVAFFFPIGMMAGVFGVNLQNGFEEVPPPWPVVTLIVAGIIFGSILAVHINFISKAKD